MHFIYHFLFCLYLFLRFITNDLFQVSKYYPIAYDYYESRNVIENNSQYIENESTKEAVLIWHIAEVLLKKIEKSATLSNTFKGFY